MGAEEGVIIHSPEDAGNGAPVAAGRREGGVSREFGSHQGDLAAQPGGYSAHTCSLELGKGPSFGFEYSWWF